MKKTFTINISGVIFHIEEDAYDALKSYFTSLKTHFGTTGEGKEIVDDIETRIAEIFSDEINEKNEVITIEHVNKVIDTMGTVGEIEKDEKETNKKNQSNYSSVNRRLYRDPLHRYFGGVCGGLAAYFNTDRLLIRLLAFILILLSQGVGLLAYIVLWIVVPKATTTAQRLEMHGQEANIKNIENSVKSNVDNEQHNQTNEIKKIDTSKNTVDEIKQIDYTENSKNTINEPTKQTVKVDGSAGNVILMVIGTILVILSFLGLLGLIPTLIMGEMVKDVPFVWSPDIQIPDFTSPVATFLGTLSIGLIAGIPLLGLLYVGSKMLFRYDSNNKTIGLGMLTLWVLALGILVVITTITQPTQRSNRYLQSYTTFGEHVLPTSHTKTLQIKLNDAFSKNDEIGTLGKPTFDIEPTSSSGFILSIRKSYDSLEKDADNFISYNYTLHIPNSTLILDPYFTTTKGKKIENSQVHIILKVPEGKSIYLSKGLEKIIYDIDNTSNTYDDDMVDKEWEMKPEGLTPKDSLNKDTKAL